MQEQYFDFNTLKQDLIDAIEQLDANDPKSSEAIIEMYNVLQEQGGYGIKLYHNEIKQLVKDYKHLEEDLQAEFAEERPDAAYITSYKRELEQLRMQLLNIAKIQIQTSSSEKQQGEVTPEELVTYWLTYEI